MIAFVDARRVIFGRVRQQSLWDAAQIRDSLDKWESGHVRYLQLLAISPRLTAFKPEMASTFLNEANKMLPNYSFLLFDPKGNLVSKTGSTRVINPLASHRQFMGAVEGLGGQRLSSRAATVLAQPPLVDRPCLASSVPVSSSLLRAEQASGYLTSCLLINDLSWVANASMLVKSASGGVNSIPVIDLDVGKRRGWASLLVFPSRTFIELDPSQTSVDEMAHLDPLEVQRSPWFPVIQLALRAKTTNSFEKIAIDGVKYFVAINRQRPHHPVVILVDQATVFAPVDRFFVLTVAGHLLAVALGTVLLLRICGELSRPIDRVGERLLAISHGEFGDQLPERDNDVGRLYHYVNQFSQQLQRYLVEERQHAALDVQLMEARRIQANFVVKDLPQTDSMQLAALFQPAYQIGADWYDAFVIQDQTFIVVADVCDKGIPSALYMSVFRSLLRNSLQQESLNNDCNPEQTLRQAITTVNAYMASNHGETGMFATVFVAAYDASSSLLHYIVAGHEQPLMLNGSALQQLELGGPAVGIFAGADFRVASLAFPPGSILLAFTDGLPDARSPEDVGFGSERILRILKEHLSSEWTADDLIARLHDAVTTYMDGADQFDDLTLLALKALRTSPPQG